MRISFLYVGLRYISMMGVTLAFCAGIVVLKGVYCHSLIRGSRCTKNLNASDLLLQSIPQLEDIQEGWQEGPSGPTSNRSSRPFHRPYQYCHRVSCILVISVSPSTKPPSFVFSIFIIDLFLKDSIVIHLYTASRELGLQLDPFVSDGHFLRSWDDCVPDIRHPSSTFPQSALIEFGLTSCSNPLRIFSALGSFGERTPRSMSTNHACRELALRGNPSTPEGSPWRQVWLLHLDSERNWRRIWIKSL